MTSNRAHVHYHVAVPDGVFTEGGDRAGFHSLPQLLEGDIEIIAANVEARVLTWLERCLATALVATTWRYRSPTNLRAVPAAHEASTSMRASSSPRTIARGGKRLLRYCARPSLSLERLSLLPDGRVAYALRKPWGRQTHRVMDREPLGCGLRTR